MLEESAIAVEKSNYKNESVIWVLTLCSNLCTKNTCVLGTCGELKCSLVQLLSFGADSRALGDSRSFSFTAKEKKELLVPYLNSSFVGFLSNTYNILNIPF
jgi:hypothetical protein